MQQTNFSCRIEQMTDSPLPTFQDYFRAKFKEWENEQEDQRTSITAFATWLTDNSYKVTIRQQLASDWYYGKYEPKDDAYLLVLEEKFGSEIYKILGRKRPNKYLQIVNNRWDYLPDDVQKRFAEEAQKYETENISKRVQRASKQRKTRKSD
jgi:hypothetical protein